MITNAQQSLRAEVVALLTASSLSGSWGGGGVSAGASMDELPARRRAVPEQ